MGMPHSSDDRSLLRTDLSRLLRYSFDESPKTFGTFTIIRRCLALSRFRLLFTLLALVGSLIPGGVPSKSDLEDIPVYTFFIVIPAILFSAQAAGQIFSLAPNVGREKGCIPSFSPAGPNAHNRYNI